MTPPPPNPTLMQLAREGRTETVTVNADDVRALLDQAGKHVATARAALDLEDFEGAHTMAYDACRKTALALVWATGLRPKGEGHHEATFEAASAIADSFGAEGIVQDAGNLRYARNSSQYRARSISSEDAEDAVSIADELAQTLREPVEQILAARP